MQGTDNRDIRQVNLETHHPIRDVAKMKFAEFIHRCRGDSLIILPKVQVRVANKDFAVPWKYLPKQISVIFEHREADVDVVFFGLEDDLPDNRLRIVCLGCTNSDRKGLRQTIEYY